MKEIIVTVVGIVVVVALALAIFLGDNGLKQKVTDASGEAGEALTDITEQLDTLNGN